MADLVLMIAGQSNGVQMCTIPVASCNPMGGTYVWSGSWRAMTSSDGAGMIELANDLRQNGYANVCVYDCSYSASSIVLEAASPPTNCWQNPDPPIVDCMAQVAAGGKIPQFVIWIQGEAEVSYAAAYPSFDMVDTYQIRLDQVRLFLLGRWGVTGAQCVWMVTPVGKVASLNTQSVVQAQSLYAASIPGVFLGPRRDDLAVQYDNGALVHLTGPSCRIFGDRLAASLLTYIQGLDMADAQAIASLQTAITGLQAGITSLQTGIATMEYGITSLESKVARLQQSFNSMQNHIAAIQSANPDVINWPTKWLLKESVI